MEVLAEGDVKLTLVNLDEFGSDVELKRAIEHFSKFRTPYIEAVIDKDEIYGSITITVPGEWEKNCVFLFEELYERLFDRGLNLARYSPPEYTMSGFSFKEVTFFLPFLYEQRIKTAKEIAKIAHECVSEETGEIAGEIKSVDGIQYVVVRNSHEFWCNDYKNGERIIKYCIKYRLPYIQLGLNFPYSKSKRARIDIYLLKEWVEENPSLPEEIKNKLIQFVYTEPVETDILAHSPPRWFINYYGFKSDWWGMTTPEFVIVPAVTTNQRRAEEVVKSVSKIVSESFII
jgi:hypothetical protein